MAIYKKKTGNRLINSISVSYDGINFKSRLEKNMYVLLKEAKIKFEYEKHSYDVFSSFLFSNQSFERQSNGKGDFINRGNKIVKSISYKPDFVGDGFIIETKGLRTESFNLRFKLFKKYLQDVSNNPVTLYMPQTATECKEVIKLILKNKVK